jgi:hypothetical protein
MLFRKYFAFFESIHPWTSCCLITWWVDRLLVEFGHRTTSSPICIDTELQYVRLHQYITVIACLLQIFSTVYKRRRQFKRELALVDIVHMPCICHVYALNTVICIAWTVILACIIDVSPWLCVAVITNYRASISLFSIFLICLSIVLERIIWDKTLSQSLDLPIEI